jgi:ribonuclease HIII
VIIIDNHTDKGFADIDDIVELLNELHYENYNLELHSKSQSKAYHKLLDSFTRLKRKNKELQKENEQLKQRNEFLKKQLDRVCDENEIMGDKLKQIGRML